VFFPLAGRILQKSQLLAGLSEEAISFFVEYAELRTAAANTVIIQQGDIGNEFFIAETGGFNFSVFRGRYC
jgi:CRP-like cAMP-binding protein